MKPCLSAIAAVALLALGSPVLADPAPAAAPAAPAAAAPLAPGLADAVAMLKLYSPEANPTVHEAGYASINVATTGTRTQMICASAASYDYIGYGGRVGPVREIYAYVEKFTGQIDPALAQRVLADNDQQLPTGAWAIITAGDGVTHYLVYESYAAVDASAEVVQRMVTAAAETTDKLEAEVTGKDDW
jgi:hypothetical protein